MFLNEGLASLSFGWVEGVDLGNLGDKVRAKFNGVIIGVMRRKLVMGFFREDICKVFTPFQDDWFCVLDILGDLGGDGGLVDLFHFQPGLSFI